jgi:hypothetical protein
MQSFLVNQLIEGRRERRSLSSAVKRALLLCRLTAHDNLQAELRRALWNVVGDVEREGERLAAIGKELPYHNRAHVSDAVTALSCLMHATTQLKPVDQWLGIIAMAGHDLGHQGKTNLQLQTNQESITADWVVRRCLDGLSTEHKSQIRKLIEFTDPSKVRQTHLAFRKSPTDQRLLLQILINEADIAASLVPDLAPSLTRALLIERGIELPTNQEVRELYEAFEKQCMVSSDAAIALLGREAW